MKQKILIVEDNPRNRKDYVNALQIEFDCIEAEDGQDGLAKAIQFKPALIVTDVCMREVDGITLCRLIKQTAGLSEIPVIMCTSVKTDTSNQTMGYIAGAVGYLVKPVDPELLLATVKSHLNQHRAVEHVDSIIEVHEMCIDSARRTVYIAKKRIDLTPKEFDLLFELVSGGGRVKSVNYLLETIWKYNTEDYNDPSTVKAHLSSLRKKLGRKYGDRILAITGHGYKYEFD